MGGPCRVPEMALQTSAPWAMGALSMSRLLGARPPIPMSNIQSIMVSSPRDVQELPRKRRHQAGMDQSLSQEKRSNWELENRGQQSPHCVKLAVLAVLDLGGGPGRGNQRRQGQQSGLSLPRSCAWALCVSTVCQGHQGPWF